MVIGSLFSGIGGLELGLEWAGLGPIAWQVERDEFCRCVLAKHWPAVDRSVTDVRDAGAATLVPVDIICGGFPCQDVSGAGKGAGLAGERSGLWYEYLRVVRELRPRIVVVENVESGARRWLCEVRSGLQELGYHTEALGVSAADVGAPHLRKRIFVVADANSQRRMESEGREQEQRRRAQDGSRRAAQLGMGRGSHGLPIGLDRCRSSEDRPVWPEGGMWPAGRGDAQHAWEPPRTAHEKIPNRRARVKALGNAVVPQCAAVVGLAVRRLIEKQAG